MSMQMNAYLKKEQIGTLFVRVRAPEGGLGGGGQGDPAENHMCLSKKISGVSCIITQKLNQSVISKFYYP